MHFIPTAKMQWHTALFLLDLCSIWERETRLAGIKNKNENRIVKEEGVNRKHDWN